MLSVASNPEGPENGGIVSIIKSSPAMGRAGLLESKKSYKEPSRGPRKRTQSKEAIPQAMIRETANLNQDCFLEIYAAAFFIVLIYAFL
jgi:hypothetical protein